MSVEIKWKDTHPVSGERRFLRAAKFAGEWHFSYRMQRRDVRWRTLKPTREMWEHVLESIQRRYRRREGISDEDVTAVERILKDWRQPFEEEE
jgi:hypothetical protein